MKLSFLLLIIPLLHVSAITRAQNISINRSDVSLVDIFKDIRNQTDYDFLYSSKQLTNAKRVNIQVSNVSIKDVLDLCFKDQPFTYNIENKTITIIKKEPSFLDKVISHFNGVDVSGKVLDENSNMLAGATIKLEGTNIVVTTNESGFFTINSKEENGILTISYLGYKTEQVSFSPANPGPFTITLKQEEAALKEIEINAGYYTVKEKERTGNITKISAETIGKQPVNNPLLALQGRVPGLVVTQQTGVPGGGVAVQIRGRNSINTQVDNDPLYIIDGVTYPSTKVSTNSTTGILGAGGASPLSLINSNDIESIEVLKDADATAIYGSRGANGVILIKTKRGLVGAPKIVMGITRGFSAVASHLDLLNTEEYLAMRKEAFMNDGLSPSATDYDVNGVWDQNKYTDWQEEIIGNTAKTTNATVNLSGGSERVNYLIGGNYYGEGTVFSGDFGFRRGGMHTSLILGSDKDKLNVNFTANYSNTLSNLMNSDLTSYINLAPNAPDLYDQYGKLNWSENTVYINPMASLLRTNEINTNNLVGNLTLSYRLLRNLFLKTSLGYTGIKNEELKKLPFDSYAPGNNPTMTSRQSYFSNVFNNTWLAEPQITYNAKLGLGDFSALVGLSFQENNTELRTIKATGFNSDELMDNIGSASVLSSSQMESSQYHYTALFARLNYNLKSKYLLNLTARRDGSSRFGKGSQFANFGAIGAAWIFSEEKLIKEKLHFLSFGKLRGSYGITGNDQIPDYGYLQLWTSNSGSYQGIPTIAPTTNRIGNPNFAWETNRKAEAALQLGFLKDRVNLEISYYRNRSSNQLIGEPLPLSTGNSSIQANRPAIVQNSGWEFATNFKILEKQNFYWSASFNLSIPRNKLISYPGIENSSDVFNYLVGQPLSIRRIYNVKGVNEKTGLYDIEDRDGNGVLNDNDRYLFKFTGQYFYGGLQNTFRFKQFMVDFLFSFTKQNGNNYLQTISFTPGGSYSDTPQGNQLTVVLERWQKVNDQSSIQKFSTINSSRILWAQAKNFGGLSIADASFVRLKNVSISYALPTKWLSSVKINKAEISLQGQNIFKLSRYKGLDPETQSMSVLPPLRTLTMGIHLTF